jgi:3-methylcrotonyl-CoA carboxylase alpha subunit
MRRLLIANRGEIAVRVARGARALGIVPLGVYSDADARALHVKAMDDALRIGPAPAAQSYLDVDAILAAARALDADAVHPGYGFLSERADFARAVLDAGLIFVGPPPSALAAMGDKKEAKHRARAHDVPVVPGYDEDDGSDERLAREARAIGTPVLIKASAGGGGRGMRVVRDFFEFDDALASARREALAAFGSDAMLLERYLERPRHIEFQVLADEYGHTIHLGERECSIQRRHQKVIEEAPSTALDPALRERMGAAAVRAARAVGYANAGTAEFLLDESGDFYFLEMNARLQVEHPVTELAHGIDLVAWQLRIANGEPLTLEQADVCARAWAIEARVNAEDPAHDYRPEIGTITAYEEPTGEGIRVDSGVGAGSEIGVYYDSMLAKLIACGDDRESARLRLARALDAFRIDGLATNLPLLRKIARDDVFARGETTTWFLTDRADALDLGDGGAPDDALSLAFAALALDASAFRIGGVGIPLALETGSRVARIVASRVDVSTWRFEGDVAHACARVEHSPPHIALVVNERRIAGRVTRTDNDVDVEHGGARYRLRLAPPPQLGTGKRDAAASAGAVVAPMPGKIVRVAVTEGQEVGERELLFVLEAMKMEHRIESAGAGRVARVAVAPGTVVAGGALLLAFEATAPNGP